MILPFYVLVALIFHEWGYNYDTIQPQRTAAQPEDVEEQQNEEERLVESRDPPGRQPSIAMTKGKRNVLPPVKLGDYAPK